MYPAKPRRRHGQLQLYLSLQLRCWRCTSLFRGNILGMRWLVHCSNSYTGVQPVALKPTEFEMPKGVACKPGQVNVPEALAAWQW